ncbi:MAG: limonene-1,2-epoxide hydrolase family protein [Pseudomonadota bacterium]
MTKNPEQIVTEFLGAWPQSVDTLRGSFHDYLADDVVYENVDLTHTTNRADALHLIDNFLPGLDHITIDMLAVAVNGNKVLTERIDYLRNKEDEVLSTIRVMGIFEVVDDRITAWRDYFDMRPFVPA